MVICLCCDVHQDEGEWGAVPSTGGGEGVLLFPVASAAELALRADRGEAADGERPQGIPCICCILLSLGPEFSHFPFQFIPYQAGDLGFILFSFCGRKSLFAMFHIMATREVAMVYLCSISIYLSSHSKAWLTHSVKVFSLATVKASPKDGGRTKK